MMFKNIYKNRRVLVTGHTGFKGSWLSIWLMLLQAEIIGYSLDPPSDPNNFEACELQKRVTHVYGDVRDYEHLVSVLKMHQPEFVFHLAAQPLVRFSYQEPRLTYETNVMGTVNVLEATRQTPSVRAIVNVTSDKCYENRGWVWGYREDDPMGGHDPYSSSKGCAELVNSAYLKSFFSPDQYGKGHSKALASVRAGNVIGGGDWGRDRLIPDCVRALNRGEEIVIRYPRAIRPWQHVLDAINGYLLIGAKLWTDGSKYTGAWNFGSSENDVWSVQRVVDEVIHLWGRGECRVVLERGLHEEYFLKLDPSKARIELGWHTRFDVRRALAATVEWYRKFYSGISADDLFDFNGEQIKKYESLHNNAELG